MKLNHFPILLLLLILLQNAHSQTNTLFEEYKCSHYRLQEKLKERGTLLSAKNESDIIYTKFHWWVDPAVYFIKGEVLTTFKPFKNLSSLEFDFSKALTMDSILFQGNKLSYTRSEDILTVNFPKELLNGVSYTITFFYHGIPTSTGFGSFITDKHGPASTPVMWTLSEPFGAMEWFPCKQSLDDKIDSIDIFITHPKIYKAASNGLLQSEIVENEQITTHWKHRYPIATYLVCMAVTNYETFTVKVPFKGDTTTILNYVYPESIAEAKEGVNMNAKHLLLFDTLFGLYPFQREKYGHAQFGWGGGMEHQTMTFVVNFGFELLAHELAHHWFGDKITCGGWEDIWLNEGFATYLSGLCYEHIQPQYWKQFKMGRIQAITSQPGGSVRVSDTTSVNRIFSGRLSYAKGAMVLHQLRWILGDYNFFDGIRNYLSDPKLAYGYAKTADLKKHLEESCLTCQYKFDEYFKDWFENEGYPSYHFTWRQSNDSVFLNIKQTQSHPSVSYFEMPLPISLIGENGKRIDFTVQNVANDQNVILKGIYFNVTSFNFDPDYWLITANNTISQITSSTEITPVLSALKIAPNPVQDQHLQFEIESTEAIEGEVSVETIDGKVLYNHSYPLNIGKNQFQIERQNWTSGMYYLKLSVKNQIITEKFVVK